MIAIATIRLKLTSTAAMLTVERRAVPRSCAVATCSQAGPRAGTPGEGKLAAEVAQWFKAFGAEVTAVCSTGKMEMMRTLGADHVIDYTQEDFTQNGQL